MKILQNTNQIFTLSISFEYFKTTDRVKIWWKMLCLHSLGGVFRVLRLLIFNSSTFESKLQRETAWGARERRGEEVRKETRYKPIHLRHNGVAMEAAAHLGLPLCPGKWTARDKSEEENNAGEEQKQQQQQKHGVRKEKGHSNSAKDMSIFITNKS